MPELAAAGHARQIHEVIGKTTRVFWRVSPEGQKILSDAMRRNGLKAAAWSRERDASRADGN